MSAEYSEDILVQQTTADFFENTLKWHSVYAYNQETFGNNGTLGRKDKKEVVLTRYLREALEKINPGHPQQVYDDAIEQFTNYNISDQLITINQKKYKLIREGIQGKSYQNSDGENIDPRLKVIDFQNPENNHFLIVREMWVQGSLYNRRPDIIGFVNGIPLLFIELKKTCRNVRVAYEDNYTDYKDTIPEIFHHNAIVMLSNGIVGKIGSITSPYGYFQEWKRLQEEEKGKVDFQTMLMGICPQDNFLDIIENFIVFDDSSGKTIKIIARNHQFLGVNRAFTAIQEREIRKGKLGVFWHTQGSGKSYSMAFITRKVHRQLIGTFTFLIITDRQELDTQIVKTFAGVGAIKDTETKATDGDNLVELLKENHNYVFTLIHKFNKPGQIYSQRSDIIVISDEAHRTQYGKLAENMRIGLPNASFIGFTGTPLMGSAEDQLTREVFGDYVSTYDFQRAIEDGATVPLYYDNRGEELYYENNGKKCQVSASEELNKRLASAIEKFNLDSDEEEAVYRRLGKEYLVLTAEKRLDRIAQDLVAHYTQRWQTGKAMLVCLDKITAVRMHGLIDKYWKQAIQQQKQLLKQATDAQEAIEYQQHLQWLEATEYLVVISEAQNEVKTFQDWGLDIIPHRQIIKSRDLEEEFKKETHPFRLAIVCAMWLTGFDVPSLSTLYMDKPLQGHNLMQTIARANRVYEGKNNGLLIDYNGILKSLRAALARYARTEVEVRIDDQNDNNNGTLPYNDLNKLQTDYAKSLDACIQHISNLGFDLQELIESTGFDKIAALDSAVNAVCTNDESRARFYVLAREVFQKKQALITEIKLTIPYQDKYNAIEAIYQHLQEQNKKSFDLNAVLYSLQNVVSDLINVDTSRLPGADSGKIYDISKIDFDVLKAEFANSPTKNISVQTLKEAIERQLQRMLKQNSSRMDYYARYQQIIQDYNRETDRVTIEQTFEELLKLVKNLSEEDTRAVREGLTEEHLAVFDLLCDSKDSLDNKTRNRIKQVAQSLIEAVKAELQQLENWRDKESTKATIKSFIRDYLWSDETGLPDAYDDSDVDKLSNVVFLHVYQQYENANNHPYAA
ncbi:MAG: type I restriction endonuclease subunit R [Dolichospermum sp. DET50]|nr:type I restriction endonuclease subunit R [Dolichospermum sp. DET73]MBS3029179.1 type I restriction endonuclease subunit R [Dolichospermum sp. DET66]MBS3034380.1 type I restriction endonuclease subunit R [Dolichospermum sp. DET67]MBS3039583.1 type I restriction endonuclease subunit R [Dolichospermum sp. DET50]QSX70732.1 MAG: type I restriction endonuclease subunit R [Dolichospermum sp. DET69]